MDEDEVKKRRAFYSIMKNEQLGLDGLSGYSINTLQEKTVNKTSLKKL